VELSQPWWAAAALWRRWRERRAHATRSTGVLGKKPSTTLQGLSRTTAAVGPHFGSFHQTSCGRDAFFTSADENKAPSGGERRGHQFNSHKNSQITIKVMQPTIVENRFFLKERKYFCCFIISDRSILLFPNN